jgi:hypothetical protein
MSGGAKGQAVRFTFRNFFPYFKSRQTETLVLSLTDFYRLFTANVAEITYWHNVTFQLLVALVNDLIFRGSLEGANSCRARRLLVCYVVSLLLQNV